MAWTHVRPDRGSSGHRRQDGTAFPRPQFGPAGHPPGQRLGLANTLTLGQVKTAEKSNEITAIPQLLPMLELQGCIVTIDAMGCQQEIAQGILDRGAGYVLALKENQGQLYEDVRDLFEGAAEFGFEGVPHDYATTLNKDHGRIERRECWTISDPACLEYLSTGQDWPGLCSVVKVVGRRETIGTTGYYNSPPAERLLGVVLPTWSIENSLHPIRKDHAPQNMANRQVSHSAQERNEPQGGHLRGASRPAGER